MIIEEYGKFTMACNICNDTLPEQDSWGEAIDSKIDAGWQSKLQGGEYIDICTTCQALEQKPQLKQNFVRASARKQTRRG